MKFDRVLPLPHENYRFAGAQVIEELRRRSEERVAKSEYFAEEKKRIERYLERKKDPTLTLNKEKFLAEREELNTEKEQEELFDDLQTNDQPVFAADAVQRRGRGDRARLPRAAGRQPVGPALSSSPTVLHRRGAELAEAVDCERESRPVHSAIAYSRRVASAYVSGTSRPS